MNYMWIRRVLFAVLVLPVFALGQSTSVEEARVRPNEGMWLPFKIEQNIETMQELGFELEAADVYSEEGKSLHQGIVKLNGGSCTAEMISDQGLILTNHHCAYDAIATLSSEEEDFLTDGFWSESFAKELPIPGATVAYLVYSEDVTGQLMEDGEMIADPDTKMAEIKSEVAERLGFEADYFQIDIETMFEGLEYYLFVYKVYTDVRLVGAPPSSIGKFGHDTDNWMWPRHTGDFSLLRVYSNAGNEPADYDEANKPFTPPVYFEISLDGVEETDYAMIMGYPGTTTRYLTSSDIQLALDQTNGDRIHILGEKTSIMKAAMDESDRIRIALASDYASLMNYYKYLIGQTTMMNRYDVAGERKIEEKEFQKWADGKEEYETLLADIADLNGNYQEVDQFISYLNLGVFGADGATYALDYLGLAGVLGSADEATIAGATAELKEGVDGHYKNYFYDIDKEIFKASTISFYKNVGEDMRPGVFNDILNPPVVEEIVEPVVLTKKEKRRRRKMGLPEVPEVVAIPVVVMSDEEKLAAWADMVYATSIFTDKGRTEAFLATPNADVLGNDPMMNYLQGVIGFFRSQVGMAYQGYQYQIGELRTTYMEALREMHSDRTFYPDANSTMRVTYGQVVAYEPRDGAFYNYYTTVAGILEKEDPDNDEFIVPQKLKDLIASKDYGPYAAEDGTMRVCFLTNNDITGGNSGSPVLDDDGRLIGCAFDGNWESMSSDIYIFPQFNRTIAVDIRYVLFVIDKYAGAQRLIDEMTIVLDDEDETEMDD